MSCLKLKSVVLFLKILVNVVLSRNFGNITDYVFSPEEEIDIADNTNDLLKSHTIWVEENSDNGHGNSDRIPVH